MIDHLFLREHFVSDELSDFDLFIDNFLLDFLLKVADDFSVFCLEIGFV